MRWPAELGLLAIVSFSFAAGLEKAAAANFVDDFNRRTLNPPGDEIWDPCQADAENLIKSGKRTDGGRHRQFQINVIDKDREGPDECEEGAKGSMSASVEDRFEAERLGPSLITPRWSALPGKEESCAFAVKRDNKNVTQRNELRFTDRTINGHPFLAPHWYAITFRMEDDIPSCGSVRWVTAQWKYSDKSWPDGFDESPYLAQRFDNGVLHVTVQNGHCRCRVAKASGDIDRLTELPEPSYLTAIPRDSDLVKVKPLRCRISKEGPDNGDDCTPDEFEVLSPSVAHPESLPDPQDEWVKMLYLTKGGGNGGGRIDIWASGRFIARVKGKIGYPGSKPGLVKFKFGAYRDMFRYGPPKSGPPGDAKMLVDEICISRHRRGRPSRCAPNAPVLE